MENTITFLMDGKQQRIDFSKETNLTPTTTVLQYLRRDAAHRGTKEGCAEGDCGACTVVIARPSQSGLHYQAMNSCLMFLPRLQGCQLLTIENLAATDGQLHAVQQALVDHHASQCGYCTPGFTMSLFDHYKNKRPLQRGKIEDTLSGNLCRCTGYQTILEAAQDVLAEPVADRFSEQEQAVKQQLQEIGKQSLKLETAGQVYFLPQTLPEALSIKKQNPDILVINGSSDVALRVTKKHELLPAILDLSAVQELQRVQTDEQPWFLGSGTTLNQLLQLSETRFAALYKVCRTFGSHQIRNMATLGGNLGSASPIADLTPLLMACEAEVVLESADAYRWISLDSFITGYRQTALKKDELITGIELDLPQPDTVVDFYKISKRYDLDIATVSLAAAVKTDPAGRIEQCRLAYGGMAEQTKRALQAEDFLTGKPWDEAVFEQAARLVREEFTPISDARSGAAFRTVAAGNLLLKFGLEHMPALMETDVL